MQGLLKGKLNVLAYILLYRANLDLLATDLYTMYTQ